MKLPYIALAAIAAALLSTPAQAQPGIVTTQLDSAVVLMGGNNFVPADEAVLGTLGEGEDEEFELDLEAGNQYFVVGVCDGGCSDMDLVLTNSSGQEVEADREMDDVPMLAIEGQSGSFVLSVQMATCSSDECHYGVRVFRSR
ncbi:hypothetical protein [Longimicrobium sp.]|uniref:hypothetical protein n=1 Tax=Longimicrobium sp. TaxID=2029185 RepID=UPI003B3A4232